MHAGLPRNFLRQGLAVYVCGTGTNESVFTAVATGEVRKLTETILAALITGGLVPAGGAGAGKPQRAGPLEARLEKAQAVTDTKLEELTREVRIHNNFAMRVPVLEEQLKAAERRISQLEHRG